MGSHISSSTLEDIDEEVRRIADEAYKTAQTILSDNRDKLDMMADALMLYETISVEQIDDIMAGKKPREPAGWHDDQPSGGAGTASREEAADDKPADDSIGGPAGQH